MLEQEIWGNTIESWGISIIIVISTMLITKLVAIFNQKVLRKITERTRNKIDNVIFHAIDAPILFGIILLGIWIAIHRLVHIENFVIVIDSSYRILITLNITWVFVRLTGNLIDIYWGEDTRPSTGRPKNSQKMLPIVKRTILGIVWIIGGVMALNNVGVNISALLGTLGIGGIAFALAAQDTIKNIFAAFTIFTDRPFKIGDTIRIDNIEGTIMDVRMRSTKIRDYDNRVITLPNYKVMDASIVNISAEPNRRIINKLGLTYDTTPEKMKEAIAILEDIINHTEFVVSENSVVHFSDFADSALIITLVYFVDKNGNNRLTPSEVNMKILTRFNEAGLNFAFPTQTIYIENTETQNK